MSHAKNHELDMNNLKKIAGGYDWDDPDSLCDPADPYLMSGKVILHCEFPLCGAPLEVYYIYTARGRIEAFQPYATCPACGQVRSIKLTDIEYPNGAPA